MQWGTSNELPVSIEQIDTEVVATRVHDDDTTSFADPPQAIVSVISASPTSSGSPSSSRGQITLTLDESGATLGLTASEQYELLLIARKLRRYIFLEMFLAIIIIPLLNFPWWFFVYMAIPVTGFVAGRLYAKHPLRFYVTITLSTTACWCVVPFLDLETQTSNVGTLMFWAIFFILKVMLACLYTFHIS